MAFRPNPAGYSPGQPLPILSVLGLRVEVDLAGGGRGLANWNEAVRGIDLMVMSGEAHGLVGESGCGKSLTVLSLLDLLNGDTVRRTAGDVAFDGDPVVGRHGFAALRGSRIGYVPQDPMSALNPVFTVGEQIAETVRFHRRCSKRVAWERAVELLSLVGIPSPATRAKAYPHELSGGQRQRVLIGIALAGDPEMLIADEPTTALDVTVQAQILNLLNRLRRDRALGLLMVSHDLGVVAQTCDRVSVLYAGQIVESGVASDVLTRPAHPYTRALLQAIPGRQAKGQTRLAAIGGTVPSVGFLPSGCSFRVRCPRAQTICAQQSPEPTPVSSNRMAACHFAEIA